MAQEYPKWLYHATEGSKLVDTPSEEKELGPGWEIHPEKAKADHIKKVNELRAKAEDDQKKAEEKAAQDKAKAEADLAKQLAAQNPSAKKAAEAKAATDAKAAADAKAEADKKAADAKV
jgi:membrane protein involved in colicin uptake